MDIKELYKSTTDIKITNKVEDDFANETNGIFEYILQKSKT